MFCESCGAKLGESAKFCRGCGKLVTPVDNPPAPDPQSAGGPENPPLAHERKSSVNALGGFFLLVIVLYVIGLIMEHHKDTTLSGLFLVTAVAGMSIVVGINERSLKRVGQSVFALTILTFILVAVLDAVFPTPQNQHAKTGKTANSPAGDVLIGEKGKLNDGGTGLVTVCVSKEALDKMTSAAVAHDEQGAEDVITSGEAFMVPEDTKILEIGAGGFLGSVRKVRILDGNWKGKAGWVPYEWVKR